MIIKNSRDKVVYLIKKASETKEMYDELVKPIKDYDDINNTEIFKTIKAFVETDGSYKKTAKSLFQHENTIRYRISKAKKLLGMKNSNIEFLMYISLVVKMDDIYTDNKLY
ncbi:helix-turn-helix domain-containing protein [Clostridiaceae bacterium M8S5]|nr:helix-turn-helix domain-containing protein [Clostridiaceae bacterium M8S5]